MLRRPIPLVPYDLTDSADSEKDITQPSANTAHENSVVTAVQLSTNGDEEDVIENLRNVFLIGNAFVPSEDNEERYVIKSVLASSRCGVILEVEGERNQRYAVKIEPVSQTTCRRERRIYKDLNYSGARHALRLFDAGITRDDRFRYLILPMMGENLETFKQTVQDINTYTIGRIFQQCLLGLMDIHQSGYLHCDLKPKNILFAKPHSNDRQIIYLIDFGLSYSIQPEQKEGLHFFGTHEFASINAHKGKTQCRADDLLSLWFTMYTLFKPLPWTNLEGKELVDTKKDFLDISTTRKKKFTNDLPKEMEDFLQCIQLLKFNEIPNYALLHHFLTNMIENAYLPGHLQGLNKHLYPVQFDPDKEYIGPNYGSEPRQNMYYVTITTTDGFQLYVNGYIAQRRGVNKDHPGYLKFYVDLKIAKAAGVRYRVFVRNYETAIAGKYPNVVLFDDEMIQKRSRKQASLPPPLLQPSKPLGEINVEQILVDCKDPLYISDLDFLQIFEKLPYNGYRIVNPQRLAEIMESTEEIEA